MNNRMIPLTDRRGVPLIPADELYEPEPDSVVLVKGLHGTAWQRFSSDGMWWAVGHDLSCTWEEILRWPEVVLIYDAEVREQKTRKRRAA